ncbi:uncharacterized protein LOC130812583 [Amaranthus tricolor]|uniref:uncharacterized protein LOC130812583 n=1 Tax=Amaranthus tricolor TaxID=29722 RepID=UPI00258CB07D|nr:uncharacterized protein LOC130812583 [Amaranthus tricolor]
MDKKSSSYNSNSCYWKLYKKSVRTIRFTKQKQHLQAAVKPTTDSPSATISPNTIEDRCIRLTRVDTVTIETPPNVSMETTDLSDRCPRVFKQSVAPITTPTAAAAVADDKKEAYQKVAVIQAKPKVTVVPIEGHENRIPAIISHVDGRKKTYIAESINVLMTGLTTLLIELRTSFKHLLLLKLLRVKRIDSNKIQSRV